MARTTDLDLSTSTPESPTYRTSAVVTPATLATSDDSGAVVLADRGSVAKVMVRCDPGSGGAEWLNVAFGQCRISDQNMLIAGLRPEEYWLFGDAKSVSDAVSVAVERGARSAVDLSHGRALLEVSGPKAAKMLEKVCSLDWSEAMMPPGSATSASVAKVTCDIMVYGGRYLISADRSFGQYLIESLADAALEFGFTLKG